MKETLKKAITRIGIGKAILAAALAVQASVAFASGYPDHPVSWIVPYAPGAATDTLARRVVKEMSGRLNQAFVVENQPGAGTINAAMKMKRSPKDGYHVMSADISTLALNPALMKKLSYTPSDFTLVSMLARLPLVLVARADLPATNVTQLIDYAKGHPGQLNYASAGPGSPHHMGMELLLQQTGISMMHIPYSGTAPALTDLLAGRVDVMFGSVGSVAPYLISGKLKALGISSLGRFPTLPDVMPLHEADPRLAGYEMYAWQGLVAPAGIPDDVVGKLNTTLKQVLEDPALIKDFTNLGLEAKWSSAAEFDAYVKAQGVTWSKLVQEKGLTRE